MLSWWGDNEAKPTPEMIPSTSYILEDEGHPIAAASLFLTNCEYAAWIEHLIADPKIEAEQRHEAVEVLFHFLEGEARRFGYRAVALFSYVDKLKTRYEELGFIPTKDHVTTFVKLL